MAHAGVTRRLAAIVAADIVGYSRLMSEDEAGALLRLKEITDEILRPKVREYGGRLVKTTGDGALLEFPSAVDAVLCAVTVQRELAAREADIPQEKRIEYRVGINLGDIIYDGDDIYGDGVNVAARLEGLAEPGGISISDTVFRNVKGKLDLGFADLGPQKVKNIAEPVRTYRVLLDPDDVGKFVEAPTEAESHMRTIAAALVLILLIVGGYFGWDRFGRPASAVPDEPRLLVLPFQSTGHDVEQYTKAANENVWMTMARVGGITMVPRVKAVALSGIDPTEAQMTGLGPVTHILNGSVTKDGDRLAINARLRDIGNDGDEIWQRDFSLSEDRIFGVLAEMKTDILSTLKVPLKSGEREILHSAPTENLEAYVLFAEAEHHRETGHWNDFAKAIPIYQEVLSLDPGFTEAKIGYGWLNYEIWIRSWTIIRYPPEAIAKAEDIFSEILEDDPINADGLGFKALKALNLLDREHALNLARGGFFQNSQEPFLRYVLASVLIANGEYDEARRELQKYVDTAPRLRGFEAVRTALAFSNLGEPDKAIAILSEIEVPVESIDRAWAYALMQKGMKDEAKAAAQRGLEVWPDSNTSWSELFFRVNKDPAIYRQYKEAMNKAGIPVWPQNFNVGREADRLRGAELRRIKGRAHIFRGIDPLGLPYSGIRQSDGSSQFTFKWAPDVVFEGVSEIENDEFCFRFPAIFMNRRYCNWVYIDREASTDESPRYIDLNVFGLYRYEIENLKDE